MKSEEVEAVSAVRPAVTAFILALLCAMLWPCPSRASSQGILAKAIRPLLDFPEPFPLCGGDRLVTRNISFVYSDLIAELRNAARQQQRPLLEVLQNYGEVGADLEQLELCRWNKFRLLLQVSYFGIYADLADGSVTPQFVTAVLALRDELFTAWSTASQSSVVSHRPSNFFEWSAASISGEPLDVFLSRESEILPWMSYLGRNLILPPRYRGDDDAAAADATLRRWLRMRTPLSSIWATLALQEAQKPEVARTVLCIRDKVRRMSCSDNLYRIARDCAGTGSAELPLKALGVFSSQEAFLLRDLGAWIKHNMALPRRRQVLSVLSAGAEVYYRSQSIADRCGKAALYPAGLHLGEDTSAKVYHFYATAHNAYKLKQVSFPRRIATRVPTATGRLYKGGAFALGSVYNLVVGLPASAGATGDLPQVLKAQRLGAEFGVASYRRDKLSRAIERPRIRARASLERWPLTSVYIEDWRWHKETKGLLLVKLVKVVGVVPVRQQVALQLTANDRDALSAKGLVYPRVKLRENELLAVF